MELNLDGRVALVSGSSHGLGFAIARGLYSAGSSVVVNGRNAPAVEKACLSLGDRAIGYAADVRILEKCRELVDFTVSRLGAIDVLVCNVGSGRSVAPGSETADEWTQVLETNLRSVTNLLEVASPHLTPGRGSVVCISSIAGLATVGAPVTYSAAKAAVNALVRGLSRPLGKRGIRINAVAPGNLLFPGSTWEARLQNDKAGVEEMLAREVSLGRLGSAEEIADWVVFLSSDRASFATGAVFTVDGGQVK